MTVNNLQCNNCGEEAGWKEIKGLEISYPESRLRVFECKNCGKEGRRFDAGQSGNVQYTGALRQ